MARRIRGKNNYNFGKIVDVTFRQNDYFTVESEISTVDEERRLNEHEEARRSKKKKRKSQNTGALVIFTQVAVKSPRGLFIISLRAWDIFRNTSVRMRERASSFSPRAVNYRCASELIREREVSRKLVVEKHCASCRGAVVSPRCLLPHTLVLRPTWMPVEGVARNEGDGVAWRGAARRGSARVTVEIRGGKGRTE